MDYLDPEKKKRKRTQIVVAYTVLGILIAVVTLLLVYVVNGYTIDRQTGTVIQNGLVYVDSKPVSATVRINGQQDGGQTDARLVLAEGAYTISLQRQGYRDWQRQLFLDGGSLRRLTYARLVPETLTPLNKTTVSSPQPYDALQSADKRWVVYAVADTPYAFQLLDIAGETPVVRELPLPPPLVSAIDPGGTWELLSWSDDNLGFFASYTLGDKTTYVQVRRDVPTESVNMSEAFAGTVFTELRMRANNLNTVWLHDASSGRLYSGETATRTTRVVAEDVTAFAAHNDDTVVYVSPVKNEEVVNPNVVNVYAQRGDETVLVRQLASDASGYLLAAIERNGQLALGISSPKENLAYVYQGILFNQSESDEVITPSPTAVLRVKTPSELVFSPDGSAIMARGGLQFASYEFDAERAYRFTFEKPVDEAQQLYWADGQHVVIASEGVQYLIDFDGSNQYDLKQTTSAALGSFFDAQLERLFVYEERVAEIADDDSPEIQNIGSLEAEETPEGPVTVVASYSMIVPE